MVVLLFGAPGSGKGTQSRFISERRKIPAISTGDMLRAECRAETELGLTARTVLASGGLVDDELVNALVVKRLSKRDCRQGFILDGYPRTVPQAIFLDFFLKRSGLPHPTVIHLDVPIAVLVSRLSSRRQCSSCDRVYNLLYRPPVKGGICDHDGHKLFQRNDDSEEVVRQRLEGYQNLCGPLLRYYSGPHYHRIDGQCAPQQISGQVKKLILADAKDKPRKPVRRATPLVPYPAPSTEIS